MIYYLSSKMLKNIFLLKKQEVKNKKRAKSQQVQFWHIIEKKRYNVLKLLYIINKSINRHIVAHRIIYGNLFIARTKEDREIPSLQKLKNLYTAILS
ncbi:MAG: hypothetical protein D3914_14280 [Candidatus Electrothrix sp. LOE2]|nr:hypothetical protein [Candidatus Electrothrix sp. LOE2]